MDWLWGEVDEDLWILLLSCGQCEQGKRKQENSRFPPSLKALLLNYSEMCGFLHNLKVNFVPILKDGQGRRVLEYMLLSNSTFSEKIKSLSEHCVASLLKVQMFCSNV